jgi:hypothetical protein
MEINPRETGVAQAGTLHVAPDSYMRINTASLFSQIGGTTSVDGRLRMSDGPFALAGGRLDGQGTLLGTVNNNGGTTAPGRAVGTLSVQGGYEQGADGAMEIEIAGTTPGDEYDVLSISGAAHLDGELNIVTSNGFVPTSGQTFVILTAGTVDGTFRHVVGAKRYTVAYNPTNVTLTAKAKPGDIDDDGDVDLSDYATFADCMAGPFTTPEPTAPISVDMCLDAFDDDEDNDVDMRDFASFQRAFTG